MKTPKITFLIIIFLISLLREIVSQVTCLGTSYCFNNEFCSQYGLCYYDLTTQLPHYEKNTSLTRDKPSSLTYMEKCVCLPGYSTLPGDFISCCYPMKSQKIAFLLQFFLSFGVAQFYVGQTSQGTIKLCINIFICYFSFMYCCCAYFKETGEEQSLTSKAMSVLFVLLIILFFVWWFVDVVYFGLNLVKDGNDQPLYPW